MRDSGEDYSEVIDGGSRGDALVLADPVAKGVSNVDGEAIGDAEGDIDGLAKDEGGGMVEAWLVVVL